MTLPTAEKLTDYEFLRSLVKSYHDTLHTDMSFPPLNPDKAMHKLAQSLGMKNSHVLKAELGKLRNQTTSSAAKPQRLFELVFKDCESYQTDSPMTKVFQTRGEAVWHLYHSYVSERLLDAITCNLSCQVEEKIDDIKDILQRHELPVPPILTYGIETDEDEADAIKALKVILTNDVDTLWPVDAVSDLCELYFEERNANDDIESYFDIDELSLDETDINVTSEAKCPERFRA